MESNKISYYAGRFLRKARKDKNMTGQQLAKLMHVSQQQISRYENGKTPLTIDTLSQILKLLDKTWPELIFFVQEESKFDKDEDEFYSLSKHLINNLFR
ncbi:helix-turn-helix domain-containing protein [Providencia sp. Je.9.19]|uniref:helix-turn-helix domain-containing protein n=1 Tax=unclassified Providencia TaxID=2633465 RepID=UPI003DA90199